MVDATSWVDLLSADWLILGLAPQSGAQTRQLSHLAKLLAESSPARRHGPLAAQLQGSVVDTGKVCSLYYSSLLLLIRFINFR